jgi:hypothetical protein
MHHVKGVLGPLNFHAFHARLHPISSKTTNVSFNVDQDFMLSTEVSAYHAITHALHAQILRPALPANPDIFYISKHALDNAPLPFILITPLEPV